MLAPSSQDGIRRGKNVALVFPNSQKKFYMDSRCPPLPATIARMNNETGKNRNLFPGFKYEGEVIASWGEARLVKYLDGKLELKGGSKEEVQEAREWLSLFWHEAVVGEG